MAYDKSQIFQNISDDYLKKSQQPSANIIPDAESNAPISQQSFTMPMPDTSPKIPQSATQPTFVPGVGVLGPDLGGVVKGMEAYQAYRLNENADIRANEQLGLNKAKLGMEQDYLKMAQAELGIKLDAAAQQRKTFDQEQTIQNGMIQAAQSGGYQGAIDYLMTADPVKALAFHAAKLKVDDAIMTNDVLKSQVPAAKAQALLDTYKVGSRFAAGIMSAKPEVQQQMYNQAKPILDKFMPGVLPNEFNEEAQGVLSLMVAQGAPENIAFQQQRMAMKADSTIGKLLTDKEKAIQTFGAGSEQVQEIDTQIGYEKQKAQNALLQEAKLKADMDNNVDRMNLSWNNSLRTASKDFYNDQQALKGIANNLQAVEQAQANGDSNPAALSLLQYNMVRAANGGGQLSNQDFSRVEIATGVNVPIKKLQSFLTGKSVPLNNMEINYIKELAKIQYNKSIETQKAKEQQWVNAGGNGVKWILPSQEFLNTFGGQQQNNSQQQSLSKEQIDSMAQEAIQAGKPLQAVEQLKGQLYQQYGIK